ncbi:MAG: Ig-like domain-containing protein, partial [Chloroflexota bacterium]|nr:Ig-like domain-containing protein [Chloroflexota bacterium]
MSTSSITGRWGLRFSVLLIVVLVVPLLPAIPKPTVYADRQETVSTSVPQGNAQNAAATPMADRNTANVGTENLDLRRIRRIRAGTTLPRPRTATPAATAPTGVTADATASASGTKDTRDLRRDKANQVGAPSGTLNVEGRGAQDAGVGMSTAASQATTVTVNTTSVDIDGKTATVAELLADPGADGKISFPEALEAVNNTGAGHTINFNLNPGTTIAAPSTASWPLEAPATVIDGDVNGDGKPDVVIAAVEKQWSLSIRSNNNVIRNLVIQGIGLKGTGAFGNRIIGSYIGTDISGRVGSGKEQNGVEMREGAHGNTVENNVIAGNAGSDPAFTSFGVVIWAGAHDNVVRDNWIGVDVEGNPLANEKGVAVGNAPGTTGGETFGDVRGNIIGGDRGAGMTGCADPCNLIAGNADYGVLLYGAQAVGNSVVGNYIGVGVDGAKPATNQTYGVQIAHGARQNVVGGEHTAAACDRGCNVISGNGEYGVWLYGKGTSDNTVKGNYIGPKPDASGPLPNGLSGLAISHEATQNTIGGDRSSAACGGTCNVISGNTEGGVLLYAAGTSSNTVKGNYVGLKPDGSAAMPNGHSGVIARDGASLNIIGGDRPSAACDGACNVISGNTEAGIGLVGAGTNFNSLRGNYVGLKPDASGDIANGLSGIVVQEGPSFNFVGDDRASTACDGRCNVIGGNAEAGIGLLGDQTKENVIKGNHIGSNPAGTGNIPNRSYGIAIADGASKNVIGGAITTSSPSGQVVPCQGPCNLISDNYKQGIAIEDSDSTGNTIRQNSIYGNGLLGIDLGNNGVTKNDSGDSDAGPNELMNFPGQVRADVYNPKTGKTVITGVIRTASPSTMTVDLYAAKPFDGNGTTQGQIYLGAVTPGVNGKFEYTVQGKLPLDVVTATATNGAGSTSEFSGADLWLTGLEVTQAIQDLDNSVVLVAGKRTFVRAHVETNKFVSSITARLSAELPDGSRLGAPIPPNNQTGGIDLLPSPSNREDLEGSFYFELPKSWIVAGQTKFHVEINPVIPPAVAPSGPQETDYTNNSMDSPVLTFQSTKPFKLTLVRVMYKKDGKWAAYPPRGPVLADIKNMLPVGSVQVTEQDIEVPFVDLSDVHDSLRWPLVNEVIAFLRDLGLVTADEDALIYGMASETNGGGSAFSAPGNIASGGPDGGTAVHEIAHLLGRQHVYVDPDLPGCLGTAVKIPFIQPYPYPDGIIGGPDGDRQRFVGFEVENYVSKAPTVLGSNYRDIMSYCLPQWISDFTYTALRDQIQTRFSSATGTQGAQQAGSQLAMSDHAIDSHLLSIHDSVNDPPGAGFLTVYGIVDDETQTLPSLRLSRQAQVAHVPPREPGPYHIRLFDAGGAQIGDYPFTPSPSTESKNILMMGQIVPFAPGTRRIAIVSDAAGREIATAPVSANAPTVKITDRDGGVSLPLSGTVTLGWQGADADGDSLKYTVQYSADGGTTWQALAVDVSSTSLTIDSARLPATGGASNGIFRVVANDGVLTGSADSDRFGVPNKPAVVSIARPSSGSHYIAGQVVTLEAEAQDLDEGQLDDSQLRWISDLDGDLGTGRLHSVSGLSVGTHQITLMATDVTGEAASATTEVVIEPEPRQEVEGVAQDVVERTNRERAALGLPPLKLQPNLRNSGMWFAQDMADNQYYSHTDRFGRSPSTRMFQFGYANSTITGENIASGQQTPADVVTAWMNSPGHRANILNADFREIGVGYGFNTQDAQKRRWVQNFGARKDVYPLVINNEAAQTTDPNVSLYVYGAGWAQQMRLSNDGVTWTAWEQYSANRKWALAPGTGTRAVYVELSNGSATLRSRDSIELIKPLDDPMVNDEPVAKSDSAATDEDTALLLTQADLKGNDTDPDNTNDQLSVTAVSSATGGTVELIATGDDAGKIRFSPKPNYSGRAGFAYTLSDGELTDTGYVVIMIKSVNDAPKAVADSQSTDEDIALAFPAADLTANDSAGPTNESTQSLVVAGVTITPDTHGTVTLTAGMITYQLTNNYNGEASFSYKVCDNGVTGSQPDHKCDTGIVNLTVKPLNDKPVARNDEASTGEGTAEVVDVLANDTDVDGDALGVSAVGAPSHGTARLITEGADAGKVLYAPEANYEGEDTFDYDVSDGKGGSDTATVRMTVNPGPDFVLAMAPSSQALSPGGTAGFAISVGGLNGFNSPVTLSVGDLPRGVTASFSPATLTPPGRSILSVKAASDADTGSFQLKVSATGGGITHTTSSTVKLDFGLVPKCYGAFGGVVTDSRTGQPVAGARVYGYGSTTTDIDGRYSIKDVPLGTNNFPRIYNLTADATGYWYRQVSAVAVCDEVTTLDLEITPRDTGTISGTVYVGVPDPNDLSAQRKVTATSTPLAGVRVVVGGQVLTTDANGQYKSGPLQLSYNNAPITYQVDATKADYWQVIRPAKVEADQNTAVDLALVPQCRGVIRGNVTWLDPPEPVDGAAIRADFGSLQVTGGSDTEGKYSLAPLLGYNNSRASYIVGGSKRQGTVPYGARETVTLNSCGEEVHADLHLMPPADNVPNYGSVEGHVYDEETGESLSGARVGPVLTDGQGYYKVPSVFVGSNSDTSSTVSFTAGLSGYWSVTKSVVVNANETSTLDFRILKKRYGKLVGTVRDVATGEPVVGATVGLPGAGTTGVDGAYQSGNLELNSGNRPREWAFQTTAKGYWPKLSRATISADQTTTADVDLIKICEGASIAGRVVNATNQEPIEGATVTAAGKSSITDEHGVFSLPNLTVGTNNAPTDMYVTASAPGFYSQSKMVTIFCGARIVLDFGRQETVFGTIEGKVTNLVTGQPIADVFIGSEF